MRTAARLLLLVFAATAAAGDAAYARRPATATATARATAAKKPRAATGKTIPERSAGEKPGKAGEKAPGNPKAPALTGNNESDSAPGTTTTGAGKTLKTKTYTFGAMDVEGKLKTPQLLYFLDRVKLELEVSAPDKRSFIKELEKSADDSSL